MSEVQLQIGSVMTDDNAADSYQKYDQQQTKAQQLDKFRQLLRPADPKVDGVTGPATKPAEGGKPAEVEIRPKSIGQRAGEALTDVGGGVIEAPKQALGGVMDALDETSQFLEEMVPLGEMLGGFELVDPATGKLSLRPLSGEEMAQREDQLFKAMAPDEAETTTGGFVRATSQFLTGFLPAMKAAKAVGAGAGVLTQLSAGAIADAVVFDPDEERLATFLNEMPMIAPFVPDYLATDDPDATSVLEKRIKRALEGAALGVASEGILKALRYYRAQRVAKAKKPAPDAPEQAARDALIDAARSELIEPVDEVALRGLGDPDGAPVVQARSDDTLDTALTRLAETKARIDKAKADDAVLNSLADLIKAATAKRGEGVDVAEVMDDLLDQVRKGVTIKVPKRPIATKLKQLGGIDPRSEFASDVRSRGITAKTHPGLFRNDGRKALDNIPAAQHPEFAERGLVADDGLYVPEQAWLDALEAEMGGEPYFTAAMQREIDDKIAPVEQMENMLGELDIDLSQMTNAQVRDRLAEIADETARLSALDEVPNRADQDLPDAFDPDLEGTPNLATERDLAGLQADIAASDARAASQGLDGEKVKPKPKIFINMARIRTRDDVKDALQLFADSDAEAINAKRRGTVSNAQTKREAQKEFTELTDLIGREPGPMSAAQAVAARRMLTASGEQTVGLARKAVDPTATAADLYNFRRAMLVHYAIQAEVIAARTETARALQSWSIASSATKGAQGVVCVL